MAADGYRLHMRPPPSPAALTVVGSINMDLVARVPRIPRTGQTVLGTTLQRHHGGKGANQAVAAARLGAHVQFFGAVGNDPWASELVKGMREEGVQLSGLVRVTGASGCALINVDDEGHNAISVLPGANQHTPLPPADWRAKALLLQMEIPMATNLAWAQAAQAQGQPVVLNAAPLAPLPLALLQAVTVLVVNEGEWSALAKATAADAALAAAVQALPWRVVTCGAAGVWARSGVGPTGADAGRGGGSAGHISHTLELPGHAVQVVDTTGAGDTFCGALAASLAAGHGMGLALDRANRAAALACTAPGARGGMPRPDQLEALA